MYIMNLIHDICLTKNNINNIPRWKFITKNKQLKKLNQNMIEFLNLDIFNASENIISFLLCVGQDITNKVNGLSYSNMCMVIDIPNDDTVVRVEYYPISNRFEIKSDYTSYSIYRNTKICNYINGMWKPLTNKIKERYLDIIIQIADYI